MRLKSYKPRVFCIGWHKTGTSTLGAALLQLGYSVLGCRLDMYEPLAASDISAPVALAGEFDALQDVPWAALFRELDKAYPGSRFILTVRDEDAWLASASRHFKDADIHLHRWLYGNGRLWGNEDTYLERFRRHYAEVADYFANRPEQLLTLDMVGGDGWAELCQFLDEPVPARPFPHENQAKANATGIKKLRNQLRDATPSLLRQAVFQTRLALRRARGLPDPRNRFNNFPQNRNEINKWR